MSRYIPFLKAKQNEIKSISELSQGVRDAICPFFDFPRKNGGYGKNEFKATAERILQRLEKHLGKKMPFYFDNFDLKEELELNGDHNYSYLLQLLADLNVIPVVGLDRSAEHNSVVSKLKSSGPITSNVVAFRICPEDFEGFEVVEDDIKDNLLPIFNKFDQVDLILDCRVCSNLNQANIAAQIQHFSKAFCTAYPIRRVVVTGSSIPASIPASRFSQPGAPNNPFRIV